MYAGMRIFFVVGHGHAGEMLALKASHRLLPTGKPRFSASLMPWRPRCMRLEVQFGELLVEII